MNTVDKATTGVLYSFKFGFSHKQTNSFWTDGDTVWSYDTAIAIRTKEGHIFLNTTRYSPIITRYQNALEKEYPSARQVNNVRRGATRATLINRSRALLKKLQEDLNRIAEELSDRDQIFTIIKTVSGGYHVHININGTVVCDSSKRGDTGEIITTYQEALEVASWYKPKTG